MQLKLITDVDQIIADESKWNRVAEQRPFFRSEWLVTWLQHRVEPVTPAVLIAVDETGDWIGISPFCVEAKPLTRKLRLLGSGPVCSDYLGLITLPEFERSFAETVADWLSLNLKPDGPLGKIDSVELEGVDCANENVNYFCELLTASGFQSHAVELEGCWAVELPDTWDAMNASLSKSLRRKTKKAVQRLADPGTEIRSSDRDDINELWPMFVDLHQKRRQMLGQSGCFADSNFESFLLAATTKLQAAGRAELIVVIYKNQPLACCLMLNDGQTNYMYQSGMDPENISLEPGYQLAVLGIQQTICKKMQRFDFLRGDEPYKSRWLTQRTPLSRVRFIPRNLSSRLKHEIWKTGRSFKQRFATPEATPADLKNLQ